MRITLEIKKEKVEDDMVYLSDMYGIEYHESKDNYIIFGEMRNVRDFVNSFGYDIHDVHDPNWKLGDKRKYQVMY